MSEIKNRKEVLRSILLTVGILVLTVLLVELLGFLGLDSQNLIIVYILSILIIARCTNGYLYGVTAAVTGAFVFDFLVSEPRMAFSFTIGFPITLLIMLVVSLISCAITTQMKTQASLAQERERRAELMYEVNQKLLAARNINEIARFTAEYLKEHMRRSVVFYVRNPEDPGSLVITKAVKFLKDEEIFDSPEQRLKAESIFEAPREYDGSIIPSQPVSYIPAMSKGTVLGIIGIIGLEDLFEQHSHSFLPILVGQVTLAIELQNSFDQQQSIRIDAEREKMRGILLRAISHDLRTPLTGILSAGSIIEEQAATLDHERISSLASDIRKNSEWLIRMVENLLAVTRISEGVVKVKKTLEVAEEIMAQSVSIVRKRFPECCIHVKADEEPILVPMDAILISQVLINLLENAVKYSPPGSPVQLDLRRSQGYAQFEVSDEGMGLPDQIAENLFEAQAPRRDQAVDSVSGIGIGLSICKTIVDAHDGKIKGYNKPGGGVVFDVMLPLDG